LSPRARSASARWDPMNPAPPVFRIFKCSGLVAGGSIRRPASPPLERRCRGSAVSGGPRTSAAPTRRGPLRRVAGVGHQWSRVWPRSQMWSRAILSRIQEQVQEREGRHRHRGGYTDRGAELTLVIGTNARASCLGKTVDSCSNGCVMSSPPCAGLPAVHNGAGIPGRETLLRETMEHVRPRHYFAGQHDVGLRNPASMATPQRNDHEEQYADAIPGPRGRRTAPVGPRRDEACSSCSCDG
jgi:hypothetical protein